MTSSLDGLLDGLNPAQAAAVSILDGPLLVVAGPGSGKTRVLTHRIAALVASGVPPSRILAVTFTNKAAEEMRSRVAQLVSDAGTRSMWVTTFHSACVRILRKHHDLVGLPARFSIADTAESTKVLREVVTSLGLHDDTGSLDNSRYLTHVRNQISAVKNDGRGIGNVGGIIGKPVPQLPAIFESYNKALRARGAVDFDDLLLLTLDLFNSTPEVADSYGSRFSHVLVDEFQDTNGVQWALIQWLARQNNLCVVGDADQSIYAFRGAKPSVINSFLSRYPATSVVRLEENYRSTQHIVDACRAVISRNPAAHRPRLVTSNPAGEQVRVLKFAQRNDEASWIVSEILRRGGPKGDHAILVRTNALTRQIELALSAAGIPCELVGTVRFYDRAEIKNALSYLRLIVNPRDIFALERAVAFPRRGFGERTLELVTKLVLADPTVTILDALQEVATSGGRAGPIASKFLEALRHVEQLCKQSGPHAALKFVVHDLGALAELEKKKDSIDRVANLHELVQAVKEATSRDGATDLYGERLIRLDPLEQTVAFLENAALSSSSDNSHSNTPAVQVATMHSAKGKEWPHVYVIGLEEGTCPHLRAKTPDDIQEERRLFFVAMSRAQESLTITHVENVFRYGTFSYANKSEFLEDLETLPDSVKFIPPVKKPFMLDPLSAPARIPSRNRPKVNPSRPHTTLPPPPPALPALPGPVATRKDLIPGAHVQHPRFGDGIVQTVSITSFTVLFDSGSKVFTMTPIRVHLPPVTP